MQDLDNNSLIISDPLENIYEIFDNMNVMTTLLNFNPFWII